jgi:hypothetical protein
MLGWSMIAGKRTQFSGSQLQVKRLMLGDRAGRRLTRPTS